MNSALDAPFADRFIGVASNPLAFDHFSGGGGHAIIDDDNADEFQHHIRSHLRHQSSGVFPSNNNNNNVNGRAATPPIISNGGIHQPYSATIGGGGISPSRHRGRVSPSQASFSGTGTTNTSLTTSPCRVDPEYQRSLRHAMNIDNGDILDFRGAATPLSSSNAIGTTTATTRSPSRNCVNQRQQQQAQQQQSQFSTTTTTGSRCVSPTPSFLCGSLNFVPTANSTGLADSRSTPIQQMQQYYHNNQQQQSLCGGTATSDSQNPPHSFGASMMMLPREDDLFIRTEGTSTPPNAHSLPPPWCANPTLPSMDHDNGDSSGAARCAAAAVLPACGRATPPTVGSFRHSPVHSNPRSPVLYTPLRNAMCGPISPAQPLEFPTHHQMAHHSAATSPTTAGQHPQQHHQQQQIFSLSQTTIPRFSTTGADEASCTTRMNMNNNDNINNNSSIASRSPHRLVTSHNHNSPFFSPSPAPSQFHTPWGAGSSSNNNAMSNNNIGGGGGAIGQFDTNANPPTTPYQLRSPSTPNQYHSFPSQQQQSNHQHRHHRDPMSSFTSPPLTTTNYDNHHDGGDVGYGYDYDGAITHMSTEEQQQQEELIVIENPGVILDTEKDTQHHNHVNTTTTTTTNNNVGMFPRATSSSSSATLTDQNVIAASTVNATQGRANVCNMSAFKKPSATRDARNALVLDSRPFRVLEARGLPSEVGATPLAWGPSTGATTTTTTSTSVCHHAALATSTTTTVTTTTTAKPVHNSLLISLSKQVFLWTPIVEKKKSVTSISSASSCFFPPSSDHDDDDPECYSHRHRCSTIPPCDDYAENDDDDDAYAESNDNKEDVETEQETFGHLEASADHHHHQQPPEQAHQEGQSQPSSRIECLFEGRFDDEISAVAAAPELCAADQQDEHPYGGYSSLSTDAQPFIVALGKTDGLILVLRLRRRKPRRDGGKRRLSDPYHQTVASVPVPAPSASPHRDVGDDGDGDDDDDANNDDDDNKETRAENESLYHHIRKQHYTTESASSAVQIPFSMPTIPSTASTKIGHDADFQSNRNNSNFSATDCGTMVTGNVDGDIGNDDDDNNNPQDVSTNLFKTYSSAEEEHTETVAAAVDRPRHQEQDLERRQPQEDYYLQFYSNEASASRQKRNQRHGGQGDAGENERSEQVDEADDDDNNDNNDPSTRRQWQETSRRVLSVHGTSCRIVALQVVGHLLFSTSADGMLICTCIDTFEVRFSVQVDEPIVELSVSPDGNHIAIGLETGGIVVVPQFSVERAFRLERKMRYPAKALAWVRSSSCCCGDVDDGCGGGGISSSSGSGNHHNNNNTSAGGRNTAQGRFLLAHSGGVDGDELVLSTCVRLTSSHSYSRYRGQGDEDDDYFHDGVGNDDDDDDDADNEEVEDIANAGGGVDAERGGERELHHRVDDNNNIIIPHHVSPVNIDSLSVNPSLTMTSTTSSSISPVSPAGSAAPFPSTGRFNNNNNSNSNTVANHHINIASAFGGSGLWSRNSRNSAAGREILRIKCTHSILRLHVIPNFRGGNGRSGGGVSGGSGAFSSSSASPGAAAAAAATRDNLTPIGNPLLLMIPDPDNHNNDALRMDATSIFNDADGSAEQHRSLVYRNAFPNPAMCLAEITDNMTTIRKRKECIENHAAPIVHSVYDEGTGVLATGSGDDASLRFWLVGSAKIFASASSAPRSHFMPASTSSASPPTSASGGGITMTTTTTSVESTPSRGMTPWDPLR